MTNETNSINNLKVWFEQAISWLHVDETPDPLQRPHRQIIDMMQKAKEENRSNRVWELIGEMEELTPRINEILEQGEIFIRCAKMAGDLENLKDSLRLCLAAENCYKPYAHQHAVSLWMIGSIYWITHQRVKAIENWEKAISKFKDLRDNPRTRLPVKEWYKEISIQLEEYLEEAIESGELPAYNESTRFSSTPTPATAASEDKYRADSLDSLKWMAVAIDNPVSAGGFKPVGNTPPRGHLEISEVLIANDPYSIHVIKKKSIRKNTISINAAANEYRTIPVEGTSMNKAAPVPIESGDYVLVRLQPTFVDNDIVVAAILEFEQIATIKRGKKINTTTFQLLPESSDETHYRNPYFGRDLNGREVNILGVVEAVFKRKI